MTKRIKIERPEDLKEGMRVELKTARFSRVYEGKLYKPSNDPSDKRLDISMSTSSGHRVYVSVIDERGDFTEIKSIHRLIDGIEDVVVGDVLISGKDLKSIRKVLDVRPNLVIISDPLRSGQANYYGRNATLTFEDLKIDSWEIYISEQKIELTETEAKTKPNGAEEGDRGSNIFIIDDIDSLFAKEKDDIYKELTNAKVSIDKFIEVFWKSKLKDIVTNKDESFY